jgi:hypothetical protein
MGASSQAAFSISNGEVTQAYAPWMSVAQSSSYGHIRRLQGRITILMSAPGKAIRLDLAEMIMTSPASCSEQS